MRKLHTRVKQTKRTNEEWVADLSGVRGSSLQAVAIDELTRYLFVVIYNDLSTKRTNVAKVSELTEEELADLAMDFVQQFMEKMVENDCALLEKYHAKGHFTTWAAQVALNIVRSEFRKMRWSREAALYDQYCYSRQQTRPDTVVINRQIHDILQSGLAQLPNQTRTVFVRRMIDRESTSAIAAEMGVTPNTVSLMVHRAKKKMKAFLTEAGVDAQGMIVLLAK